MELDRIIIFVTSTGQTGFVRRGVTLSFGYDTDGDMNDMACMYTYNLGRYLRYHIAAHGGKPYYLRKTLKLKC